MAKRKAASGQFTDLSSKKAAKAFAKDVKGIYAGELKDREAARKFLREKGYLTAKGELTARYSR